jgi:hypothetical protein
VENESFRVAVPAVIELHSDHTQLFKEFSDNLAFQQWLSEKVFSMTYSTLCDNVK